MTIESIQGEGVIGTVTVVAAPYAPAGPIIYGTSNSSADVGLLSSYTFAMNEFNLGFAPGIRVRATAQDDVTNWIEGVVTAFDNVNLTMTMDLYGGIGVHTPWNITVAGQPGKTGPKGDTGVQGPQGPGGGVPADSPQFTGDPKCPTPAIDDADSSIANTQWVKQVLASYQPKDNDLVALAAASAVGVIYYRSAVDTWGPVTIGANLTFSGGTLSATVNFNSPVLTGNPTAPTPAVGDNSTSIATTAFVKSQNYAPLASPAFTGTPTAPTPANADNSTKIATTAWVTANAATGNFQPADPDLTALAAITASDVMVYRSAPNTWAPVTIGANILFAGGTLSATGASGGGGVPSDSPVFTGDPQTPTPPLHDNDATIANTSWVTTELSYYAKLASPSFSGTPRAPTAAAITNDDQIATTAFVQVQIQGFAPLASPTFTGDPKSVTPATADNDTSIATTAFVKAQGYAPLASPVLTGDPTAPTAAKTDNDTSIATTAHVKLVAADYAPLASPALTGSPTAPTPTPAADNSTKLATTAFVAAAVAAASGGGAPTMGGRLTLQSLTPVMTADQAGKNTLFYTPYIHDQIFLYNGTSFAASTFTELSALTTDTTKSPAAIGVSKVNDWFVWNDAGTLRLSHGPDWTDDLTRPAGSALVRVGGIQLNNVSITNGPAAQRGTFVGTSRSNASSLLDWLFGGSAVNGSQGWFGIWNRYNRVSVEALVRDTTSSWTVPAGGRRPMNNSLNNRVSFVTGLQEDAIEAHAQVTHTSGFTAGGPHGTGIGYDSTTSVVGFVSAVWTGGQPSYGRYGGQPAPGFHFVQAMDCNAETGGVTFYGSIAGYEGYFPGSGLTFSYQM